MEFVDAKTIISSSNGDWFGYDYGMNIYRGCSHGCIYCDSRSECYHVEDFDTVRAKKNALEIIDRELKSKRKKGVVITGGMSDPYNPFEKTHKLTRGALKLIDKHGFGIGICTKSDLVTRDIDILKSIQRHSPVIVLITITTFDDKLQKIIEPNVAKSSERFTALKKLADNGIKCGVLLMPILPFINDTQDNILDIVKATHESGANYIYPAFGVTLRQNQREYFYNKLDCHFKGLADKYIKTFGDNYSCSSQNAKALWNVFSSECEKHNIIYKMRDITSDYKKPYQYEQVSFF